ncbi:MAG: hypothetical protein KBA95_05905 [Acidobacteria bacterium]|nr:hypothetical protein [Acidobacteriota bacterium]
MSFVNLDEIGVPPISENGPSPEDRADALADFPSEAGPRRALEAARRGVRLAIGAVRWPPSARGVAVATMVLALVGLLWVALQMAVSPARPLEQPIVSPPLLFARPQGTPLPAAPPLSRASLPASGRRGERSRGDSHAASPSSPRTVTPLVVPPRVMASDGPSRPEAARPTPPPTNAEPGAPTPAPPASITRVDEVVFADVGASSESSEVEPRVYTVDDVDVRPPVAERAWFHTRRPPDLPGASWTQVEIVVSPRGAVSSARVVAGPRTFTDGMALSAIKGERFAPARKGGEAVAYRQTLWLVVAER